MEEIQLAGKFVKFFDNFKSNYFPDKFLFYSYRSDD